MADVGRLRLGVSAMQLPREVLLLSGRQLPSLNMTSSGSHRSKGYRDNIQLTCCQVTSYLLLCVAAA